jgi:hypothetical protein
MEKTVSKVNATTALKKHRRTNEFGRIAFLLHTLLMNYLEVVSLVYFG